jgi:hypothetical protein
VSSKLRRRPIEGFDMAANWKTTRPGIRLALIAVTLVLLVSPAAAQNGREAHSPPQAAPDASRNAPSGGSRDGATTAPQSGGAEQDASDQRPVPGCQGPSRKLELLV